MSQVGNGNCDTLRIAHIFAQWTFYFASSVGRRVAQALPEYKQLRIYNASQLFFLFIAQRFLSFILVLIKILDNKQVFNFKGG